MANND